jgi:hypothetical protein
MPTSDELPPGGVPAVGPEVQWDPWRPGQVADLLSAVTAPWYVAGGWALDLYRGAQTREHEDLEIAGPASAFGQIRGALAGCDFEAAGDGQLWSVDGPALGLTYQTWVSERAPVRPGGRVYRLDVFREPARDGQWAYRRDPSTVLPYARIIRHDAAGVPYLAPEIALLFNAKQTRPKDTADFAGAVPLLTSGGRQWLRRMLERLHPGHPWIGAL